MFGSKKLLAEKDKRIAWLEAEIQDLRRMVYAQNDPLRTPVHIREMDYVMGGSEEAFELNELERAEAERLDKEADEVAHERDRILAGNY